MTIGYESVWVSARVFVPSEEGNRSPHQQQTPEHRSASFGPSSYWSV